MSDAFTPISSLGEFGLIDRAHEILGDPEDPDLVVGIGDDAAVYRVGNGRVHVVTTDALVENVHFDRAFTPLTYLGFKAISANVSDIIAMNARPRFATVALAVPSHISVEMIETFYRGMKKASQQYGVRIIGGDTTAAHRLTISVTMIGEASEEDICLRSGARPGDVLCVTGDLGAAYAGLKILLNYKRELEQQGEGYEPDFTPYSFVIQRQLAPTARLDAIEDWRAREVKPSALIDISDGLASEVHHLCSRSGCGARIVASAIPIDLETRRVADELAEDVDTYALFGGEDYELLFALPKALLDALAPEIFSAIGEITPADEGVRVMTPEGGEISLEAKGYEHFN